MDDVGWSLSFNHCGCVLNFLFDILLSHFIGFVLPSLFPISNQYRKEQIKLTIVISGIWFIDEGFCFDLNWAEKNPGDYVIFLFGSVPFCCWVEILLHGEIRLNIWANMNNKFVSWWIFLQLQSKLLFWKFILNFYPLFKLE